MKISVLRAQLEGLQKVLYALNAEASDAVKEGGDDWVERQICIKHCLRKNDRERTFSPNIGSCEGCILCSTNSEDLALLGDDFSSIIKQLKLMELVDDDD